VVAEAQALEAATGRRVAAAPWFPSNPVAAFSIAQRRGVEGRSDAVNATASLSQEIDVSGQRASRRRAADADVASRAADVQTARRRVAARALTGYFELLAARDAALTSRKMEQIGERVAKVTRARAEAGVGSLVDADVAEAAHLRLVRARIEADRAERIASSALATLVGGDPAAGIGATGELSPLDGSDALASGHSPMSSTLASGAPASGGAERPGLATPPPRASVERPELRGLREQVRLHGSRAEAFRRARFPTLTLQVFAQNDGFDERVLGGGLAVPLPLPQPLGRTFAGEAREEGALAAEASARLQLATRTFAGERAASAAAYETARSEVALYTAERVARAERVLVDMAQEIEAGRLAVRDAVVAQRELTDLLAGRIDARRALSVASVDLAVASGVLLEEPR